MILWFILIISHSWGQYVDSPEDCLELRNYPCTISAQSKVTISGRGHGFYLSAGTLMEWVGKDEIRLVRGHLWGQHADHLQLDTPYGVVTFSGDKSEFWVDVGKEEFDIKIFSGEANVLPKGKNVATVLERGQHAFLGVVDYKNKSCFVSNPATLSLSEHIHRYGKVFPFGQVSVDEHLRHVAGAMLWASEQEGAYLKAQVSRQLASAIEREHRQKLEKIEWDRLQKYLQRLYRIKSNFEEK